MKTSEIVIRILEIASVIAPFINALLNLKMKGIMAGTDWTGATEKECEHMDNRKYYRESAGFWFVLGIAFCARAIRVETDNKRFIYVELGIWIIAIIIYCFKKNKKRKVNRKGEQ